jgi:hypothetical protein
VAQGSGQRAGRGKRAGKKGPAVARPAGGAKPLTAQPVKQGRQSAGAAGTAGTAARTEPVQVVITQEPITTGYPEPVPARASAPPHEQLENCNASGSAAGPQLWAHQPSDACCGKDHAPADNMIKASKPGHLEQVRALPGVVLLFIACWNLALAVCLCETCAHPMGYLKPAPPDGLTARSAWGPDLGACVASPF